MIDFETGVRWCAENGLFYNLDIKKEEEQIVFFITIYSRDEKGEIEDYATGTGINRDEAMDSARHKWGQAKPLTSQHLLHLCLDLIDQLVSHRSYIVTPTQKHPAPFDMDFLVATLRKEIANHLKE